MKMVWVDVIFLFQGHPLIGNWKMAASHLQKNILLIPNSIRIKKLLLVKLIGDKIIYQDYLNRNISFISVLIYKSLNLELLDAMINLTSWKVLLILASLKDYFIKFYQFKLIMITTNFMNIILMDLTKIIHLRIMNKWIMKTI